MQLANRHDSLDAQQERFRTCRRVRWHELLVSSCASTVQRPLICTVLGPSSGRHLPVDAMGRREYVTLIDYRATTTEGIVFVQSGHKGELARLGRNSTHDLARTLAASRVLAHEDHHDGHHGQLGQPTALVVRFGLLRHADGG
jgi:hypothetical protein